MALLIVVDDHDPQTRVDLFRDDDGNWTGGCSKPGCRWLLPDEMGDADAVMEAIVHIDHQHEENPHD